MRASEREFEREVVWRERGRFERGGSERVCGRFERVANAQHSRSALEKELERQKQMEDLRKKFAEEVGSVFDTRCVHTTDRYHLPFLRLLLRFFCSSSAC